jgi:hypothetical protein
MVCQSRREKGVKLPVGKSGGRGERKTPPERGSDGVAWEGFQTLRAG